MKIDGKYIQEGRGSGVASRFPAAQNKVEMSELQIVNLCPHPVTVITGTETTIYPPSGQVARIREEWWDGYPDNVVVTYGQAYVEGDGLDNPFHRPEDGTIYIVSNLVALAEAHRTDLRIPGKPVRDSQGRVIGCECLARAQYALSASALAEVIATSMNEQYAFGHACGRSA